MGSSNDWMYSDVFESQFITGIFHQSQLIFWQLFSNMSVSVVCNISEEFETLSVLIDANKMLALNTFTALKFKYFVGVTDLVWFDGGI